MPSGGGDKDESTEMKDDPNNELPQDEIEKRRIRNAKQKKNASENFKGEGDGSGGAG